MKTLVFLLSAVFFITGSCLPSHGREIVRLANGEWPPYYSEHLKDNGVGSKIVKDAFALEHVTVVYGFFSWSRAMALAKSGEWDGVVGYQTNPERDTVFHASDVIWEAPWVFFHLKTMPFQWKTFKDLRSFTIGATVEYMYTYEFLEAERKGLLKVYRINSDEQNFMKLAAGRIDLFPQLLDSGVYQYHRALDASSRRLITYHPKPFGVHGDQVLFPRANSRSIRLMTLFNRGLKQLKAKGIEKVYFKDLRGK